MAIEKITDENYEDFRKSEKAVLVLSLAKLCGACKRYKPTLSSVAEEISHVRFGEAELDEGHLIKLKRDFPDIKYVPTTILVRNGEVVHRFDGECSADKLSTTVRNHLADKIEKRDLAKLLLMSAYTALYGINEAAQRLTYHVNSIYPTLLKNYLSNFAGTASFSLGGVLTSEILEGRDIINNRQSRILKKLSFILPATAAIINEIHPFTRAARVSDPYDIVVDLLGAGAAYVSYKLVERFL